MINNKTLLIIGAAALAYFLLKKKGEVETQAPTGPQEYQPLQSYVDVNSGVVVAPGTNDGVVQAGSYGLAGPRRRFFI